MTEDQFSALARLLRLHKGSASSVGLRLVLVCGMTHQSAAQETGASRQGLTKLVASARATLADCQALHGVKIADARRYL